MSKQPLLKGLKVQTFLEPGYIFAPYIPLQISSVIVPSFQNPCGETDLMFCRKTDCLVVGEMYRIEMMKSRWIVFGDLYKKPSTSPQYRIGRVQDNQIITYLGESVFELMPDGSEQRMGDDRWYYKVFADDQVGYVFGPHMRLIFLKTELERLAREAKNHEEG